MLRRSLFGTLTLLGAVLALPGVARAQSGTAPPNAPGPTPPGLDAVAIPLSPNSPIGADAPYTAQKVIATSQPESLPSLAPVPVPDDGLALPLGPAPPGGRQPAPSRSVRTAVYRPDLDAGPVEQVGGSDGRPVPAGGPRTPAGARVELRVEATQQGAPGKPFVYTIRVLSVGGVPAGSVRVSDHLSAGVRLIGADPKPEIAGDRLAWELGDMAPGTERRLTVALDAEKLTAELLVRPVVTFGVASGLRLAPPRQPLEVRLAGPETAPPGTTVPYRVLISNNGTIPLGRVLIQVKLTPGLRHPRLAHGSAIEADVRLAAGETKTLPLDLIAGSAGPNLITATARADGGPAAETRAPVQVDPSATVPVSATRPAPELRVEISNLSDSVPVGTTAVYEVKLLNPSDTPHTGIRMVAELSEGFEPDQADGPTAAALTLHGMVFETLWKLGPGQSAIYHVRARTRRPGVQQLRVEVNADRLAQPTSAEANVWVAPGRGR